MKHEFVQCAFDMTRDRQIKEKSYAGIDEVGMGSLAGPMVSAVVVLPEKHKLSFLPKDSKKMTETEIDKAAEQILEEAAFVRVCFVNPHDIDTHGFEKSKQSMWGELARKLRRRFGKMHIIVDGAESIKGLENHSAVVKADATRSNVSAAAIVAKSWFNKRMRQLHQQFPIFNLKQNKGYCTQSHLQSLCDHGISPIHRKGASENAIRNALKKGTIKAKSMVVETIKDVFDQVLPLLKLDMSLATQWELKFLSDQWKSFNAGKELSEKQKKCVFRSRDSILANAKRKKLIS